MIRILQVIGNMNGGGMENMIMNYYRNIDREKIQFDFLIFNKEHCLFEDEICRLGGKIYRVTSRRNNFIKNRKEITNFFKNNKYDIAEFHQGITYYYPLKMAKKYGVKNRIIHNHGIDRNFLKKFKIINNLYLKKRISNLANQYFTCSEEVENHLFSKKVIESKKIKLINNAIDLDRFKFSKVNRYKIRNEFNIKENEILIGHVGTFTTPKNHLFLISIFNEYLKLNKNAKLLLVGKGPLENQILEKIREFNLDKKVVITQDRKDVNEIMSAIDYFIFPSLFEGLPLTLIEAQTSGLPIFISDSINKKSMVIDNGEIISLQESSKIWAARVNKFKSTFKRETCFNLMLDTKFNIKSEVKKLEKIYLKMI